MSSDGGMRKRMGRERNISHVGRLRRRFNPAPITQTLLLCRHATDAGTLNVA